MRGTRRVVTALLCLFVALPLYPCSTFCLTDGEAIVFGRNYDFETGVGMLVVSKRGVQKRSVVTSQPGAAWTSRFGSVTFNQFGREFPMGGMNEAGLVVELMWLEGTVYPSRDDRPAVALLEWIQYQLDTAANVDELIASDERVRIRGTTPLHFLVSDASGASATIEFLEGQLVVHRGSDLPVAVLTNDRYDQSSATLRSYKGFGGSRTIPSSPSSLDRFVRAASMVRAYGPDKGSPVDYAFRILDSVAQPNWTRWSIVYDIAGRQVHFKTESAVNVKTLTFASLDFSCATQVEVLDLHSQLQGDVSSLLDLYTREANLALITVAHRQTSFLRDTPMSELEADAAHPDETRCWAPVRRRGARH
jgi:choloylglycine hydrolase